MAVETSAERRERTRLLVYLAGVCVLASAALLAVALAYDSNKGILIAAVAGPVGSLLTLGGVAIGRLGSTSAPSEPAPAPVPDDGDEPEA